MSGLLVQGGHHPTQGRAAPGPGDEYIGAQHLVPLWAWSVYRGDLLVETQSLGPSGVAVLVVGPSAPHLLAQYSGGTDPE